MSKQNNVTALLADSWVTTRDEINTNCVITNQENLLAQNSLNVYPNPADEVLSLSNVLSNYYITNQFGQVVQASSNPTSTIPTINLTNGLYFLISDSQTTKFMVRH